ncbi:hypothetical protein BJF90_41370 [Pseudonocardia sp. CNS-004]|nr:hypothetical protein BJF90_41370 [Pseudonocardia sp. CNS-004]
MLAHRRRAAAAIALLFVAGAGALALLLPVVSERNEYPALTSYRANQMILEVAGTGGYERPIVPVVTLPPGAGVDSPATRDALAAAFGAAAAATGGRALSYADVPDPALRSPDGRVSAGLLFGPPREEGGIPGSALGEAPASNPPRPPPCARTSRPARPCTSPAWTRWRPERTRAVSTSRSSWASRRWRRSRCWSGCSVPGSPPCRSSPRSWRSRRRSSVCSP